MQIQLEKHKNKHKTKRKVVIQKTKSFSKFFMLKMENIKIIAAKYGYCGYQ